MTVDLGDSGQDAVYVHTPNPHTEFPYGFEDVAWGVEAPPLFDGVFDPALFDLGRSKYADNVICWLRPVGVTDGQETSDEGSNHLREEQLEDPQTGG